VCVVNVTPLEDMVCMRVIRVIRGGGTAPSDGGFIGCGVVVSTAYIADNEALLIHVHTSEDGPRTASALRMHIAHIHHLRHRHRRCLVLKGFEGSCIVCRH
jgi:hypothetical protein